MTVYTQEFYNKQSGGSLSSAQEVVPLIMEIIQPKRVLDIGCGVGTWLKVFQEHGVEEILGIDGDYVDKTLLKIPQEYFLTHDLTKPLKLDKQFDLVVSLEVAEHISSENAETFVDTLTAYGSAIFFSAAIPYQIGDYHVNCQWPAYWEKLFASKGYVLFDCLRMKFWQNQKVEWWYAQNMLLFIKEDYLNNYSLLAHDFHHRTSNPLSLVHPEYYLEQFASYQQLIERWDTNKVTLNQALLLLAQVVKKKLSKLVVK